MMHLVRDWWRLVCDPAVVVRGLKFAVVVGAVLVAINHGDAILRGDVDTARLVRIALTVLVPYCVSALSSAGAMRQLQRSDVPPSPGSLPRSSTRRSP